MSPTKTPALSEERRQMIDDVSDTNSTMWFTANKFLGKSLSESQQKALKHINRQTLGSHFRVLYKEMQKTTDDVEACYHAMEKQTKAVRHMIEKQNDIILEVKRKNIQEVGSIDNLASKIQWMSVKLDELTQAVENNRGEKIEIDVKETVKDAVANLDVLSKKDAMHIFDRLLQKKLEEERRVMLGAVRDILAADRAAMKAERQEVQKKADEERAALRKMMVDQHTALVAELRATKPAPIHTKDVEVTQALGRISEGINMLKEEVAATQTALGGLAGGLEKMERENVASKEASDKKLAEMEAKLTKLASQDNEADEGKMSALVKTAVVAGLEDANLDFTPLLEHFEAALEKHLIHGVATAQPQNADDSDAESSDASINVETEFVPNPSIASTGAAPNAGNVEQEDELDSSSASNVPAVPPPGERKILTRRRRLPNPPPCETRADLPSGSDALTCAKSGSPFQGEGAACPVCRAVFCCHLHRDTDGREGHAETCALRPAVFEASVASNAANERAYLVSQGLVPPVTPAAKAEKGKAKAVEKPGPKP